MLLGIPLVAQASNATADGLVRVTLNVRFGTGAPRGCYQVTDLLPSGLAPIQTASSAYGYYAEDAAIGPYEVEGQRVSWCIGPSDPTWQLGYTARVVTADEAFQMGLLNKVVPSDQLLDAAIEMGRQIAGNTPEMVQGIKQMMIEHLGRGWLEMYEAEKTALSTTLKPSPALRYSSTEDDGATTTDALGLTMAAVRCPELAVMSASTSKV